MGPPRADRSKRLAPDIGKAKSFKLACAPGELWQAVCCGFVPSRTPGQGVPHRSAGQNAVAPAFRPPADACGVCPVAENARKVILRGTRGIGSAQKVGCSPRPTVICAC